MSNNPRMMRFCISVILFFELVFCFSLAAQPSAEIVSTPYGICDNGVARVNVLMTGTAPFRLQYKVSYQVSSNSVTYISEPFYTDLDMLKQFDVMVGNSEDDVAVIQLLKVRDQTMPEDDWLDMSADIEIRFPIYKMPVGLINLPANSCGYTAAISARDNGLRDPAYFWESLDGGSFDQQNVRSTSFKADNAGQYTIRLTESNGVCQSQTETELTILGYPKGTIAGSTTICTSPENTDVRRLDATITMNGTAPFYYELSNGVTRSTNLPSENIVLQPNVGGDIVISTIRDGNNCVARAEDRTGRATVNDRLPVAYAVPDIHVCNSEATLNAVINTVGNIGRWQILEHQDSTMITEPSVANTRIVSTRNGSVDLRWSEININGSDCPAHDFFTATFDLPVGTVSAGRDTILYLADQYQMNASIKPWETGEWSLMSGSGVVSQVNNPQSEVTGLVFGQHYFHWTVSNGICPSVSSFMVIEVRGLVWPTGFSPNDDGFNDYFVIQGAPNVRNNELIVYDQKGKEVFRKSGYDNSWNGTDKSNRKLPDGFYYYIFTGDFMSPIKETLVIKRSKF